MPHRHSSPLTVFGETPHCPSPVAHNLHVLFIHLMPSSQSQLWPQFIILGNGDKRVTEPQLLPQARSGRSPAPLYGPAASGQDSDLRTSPLHSLGSPHIPTADCSHRNVELGELGLPRAPKGPADWGENRGGHGADGRLPSGPRGSWHEALRSGFRPRAGSTHREPDPALPSSPFPSRLCYPIPDPPPTPMVTWSMQSTSWNPVLLKDPAVCAHLPSPPHTTYCCGALPIAGTARPAGRVPI